MVAPNEVRRVAVIGAGTIGASWAAYFLSRGLEVSVQDPSAAREDAVRSMIRAAWPILEKLGMAPGADPERWRFTTDPRAAVRGADFVQESAPERADVKIELYAALEEVLGEDVVIASSTSGLLMSELQQGRRAPQRFAVGHPFNPPHLIPLVEVVGGRETSEDTLHWCLDFYRAIGKHPIHIRREVPAHLANRLQAALWREAVHAVATGVASVEDVDAAIAYGPGLRWAIMGPNLIFHLAGGEGGMRHFLEHLGDVNEAWWKTLGTPSLTPEVRAALIEGVNEEAAGRSIPDLARERDRLLVALLQTLGRERGEKGEAAGE